MGVLLGTGIFIALIAYVLFQARFLIAGPSISLASAQTQAEQAVIEITGQTENHTSLTLNGRSIFTDENGHFSELLVTTGSYTIMTLRAKDRYGREVTLERIFTQLPQS